MFDGIYNLDPGHFVIISKSNGIKKISFIKELKIEKDVLKIKVSRKGDTLVMILIYILWERMEL